MKIKDSQLRVILDSVDRLLYYIDGYSFNDFVDDKKTLDACLMQLQHLGETTKKLVDNFGDIDFLPTNEMIGLRNYIVHEYLGINIKLIYETIKNDLPELKEKIEKYLDNKEI